MRDKHAPAQEADRPSTSASTPQGLPPLIELTTETFGPFYEGSFRPLVGQVIFANEHGNWRGDYRCRVPTTHEPASHKYVAIANDDGSLAGYVA